MQLDIGLGNDGRRYSEKRKARMGEYREARRWWVSVRRWSSIYYARFSTSSICARHDYGGFLSSPGFSHGFNLWCRPSSITHLSLTAHTLLASLPSVCYLSHLYHHLRLSSSTPKCFSWILLLLHPLNIKPVKYYSTFVSDIHSRKWRDSESSNRA